MTVVDTYDIAAQVYKVPVGVLTPHPRNPRIGNVDEIAKSLKKSGQVEPIKVRKADNMILGGNHTWKAAKKLRWKTIDVVYVEDELASQGRDMVAKPLTEDESTIILLALNRFNDLATYDTGVLADILKELPDTTGTGYSDSEVRAMLASIEDDDRELMASVIAPSASSIVFEGGDDRTPEQRIEDLQQRQDRKIALHDADDGDEPAPSDDPFDDMTDSTVALQLELEKLEDDFFQSDNYYGIPDLIKSKLCDVIPEPLDVWVGSDLEVDDGKTTYIWNVTKVKHGLPWERSMLAFYVDDDKFSQWWEEPAYQTARAVARGIPYVIEPDYSMTTAQPRFMHLQAAFRQRWLGRFFQEAGLKVIPDLMWCDSESIKTGVLGVPVGAPVIATGIQGIAHADDYLMVPECLREVVKLLKPQALLVYCNDQGRQMVTDARLPKALHVVYVDTYSSKRYPLVNAERDKVRKAVSAVKKAAKKTTRAARKAKPSAITDEDT